MILTDVQYKLAELFKMKSHFSNSHMTLKYPYIMKIVVGQSNQKAKAVYNQTHEISAYYLH